MRHLRARLLVAAVLVMCFAGVPASALTVSTSADVTDTAEVFVALSADEPTGTVALYDGGSVKASHGGIRMYNRDVLELWPQVPLGTMVITRP